MPTGYTWPLAPTPPQPPGPVAPTAYSADAYARQLRHLLPRGRLWEAPTGSLLDALLHAIGDELARVDSRGVDLLEEADPRTATETLDAWERVLAIPRQATDAERRLAVTTALVQQGGQTPAYYTALAAAAGYAVTITPSFGALVLRAGFRAGDRCFGTEWAHTWEVRVSPPTGAALSHGELEAAIRATAPAHTVVLFTYL